MKPALLRSVPDDAPASRLNPTLAQIANALNGGLSWANMQAQVVTFSVTMPAAYTAPTLANGWAAAGSVGALTYAAPGYRKTQDGRVLFCGAVKSGTFGSDPIFTLPRAYWPARTVSVIARQSNATAEPVGALDISPAGLVTAPAIVSVQTGAALFLSLENIAFDAADPTPVPLGAPFPLSVPVAVPGGLPRSVEVLSCTDQTGSVPATPPAVTWSAPAPTLLQITNLAGLLPGRRYLIRLVVRAF